MGQLLAKRDTHGGNKALMDLVLVVTGEMVSFTEREGAVPVQLNCTHVRREFYETRGTRRTGHGTEFLAEPSRISGVAFGL